MAGRQGGGRPLIQHGHTLLLHTAVRRQADWFEDAEEYQGKLLVLPSLPHCTSGAQCAPKEELWSCIPNISSTSNIKVTCDIEFMQRLISIKLCFLCIDKQNCI
jgi:hypothetical protein